MATFQHSKDLYNRLVRVGWHDHRGKRHCDVCGMARTHPVHRGPGPWRRWAWQEYASLKARGPVATVITENTVTRKVQM